MKHTLGKAIQKPFIALLLGAINKSLEVSSNLTAHKTKKKTEMVAEKEQLQGNRPLKEGRPELVLFCLVLV